MTSQAFLLLNLSVGGFLILAFWFGRSRIKAPARLKLRGGGTATSAMGFGSQHSQNLTPMVISAEALKASTEFSPIKQKSLNVIFMYNGHSWDAYEVLGIPAGSRLEAVREAYKKALANTEPASLPFIECALKAIEQSQ